MPYVIIPMEVHHSDLKNDAQKKDYGFVISDFLDQCFDVSVYGVTVVDSTLKLTVEIKNINVEEKIDCQLCYAYALCDYIDEFFEVECLVANIEVVREIKNV